MKVSKLIQDITRDAESKFGLSGHLNDTISVWVFAGQDDDFWCVGLQRPTQSELDHLETNDPNVLATVKECHSKTAFYTEGYSLVGTLTDLSDKVSDATCWEDGNPPSNDR